MSSLPRTRLTEPADPGILRLLRLECHVGSSEKFYTLVVERDPEAPGACRCRAEWGRIGGAVSSQGKATGDAASCERALDALAREKQAKGYRVVLDKRGTTGTEEHPPADETRGLTAEAEPSRATRETLQDLLERRRREATWAL
jgi:predicted DNA-binding WGR domain protein